jgi:CHAT domain-containing protein
VADHEIVSLPSVSVLKALRERVAARSPAPKVLAVVADPVFGRDDLRFEEFAGIAESVAEEPRIYQPDRLERSGQEAEAILALVRPEDRFGALGFDATREVLIEGKLAGFRIVHIATHGELNDEQPEYTHLVLSLLDRHGRPLEGRLYQHEIGNLDLAADLVVLSACNSALGKHVRGEGLVGMTRGFMDAGATRVMVSLWYVSEEATALLMERFYIELLVEGKTPAAALQAAQLWLQSFPQWQSPFYWAGFVLQGEWR